MHTDLQEKKYNSKNSPSNWVNFHRISQELGPQLRRDIISKMLILTMSNTHWGVMAYLRKEGYKNA
jgi:hypothetical protein